MARRTKRGNQAEKEPQMKKSKLEANETNNDDVTFEDDRLELTQNGEHVEEVEEKPKLSIKALPLEALVIGASQPNSSRTQCTQLTSKNVKIFSKNRSGFLAGCTLPTIIGRSNLVAHKKETKMETSVRVDGGDECGDDKDNHASLRNSIDDRKYPSSTGRNALEAPSSSSQNQCETSKRRSTKRASTAVAPPDESEPSPRTRKRAKLSQQSSTGDNIEERMTTRSQRNIRSMF